MPQQASGQQGLAVAMNRGLRIRREALLVLAVLGGMAAMALTVLLPLVFVKLSSIKDFYTVVSALVSSFALVGVALSLLYQARAGHTAREQAIRSLQQQLIKMQMDDPTLMTAMGAPWGLPIPAESARIRDHLYIHMWATFWAGNYVVGELNAAAVRGVARAELFSSEAGRTYWSAVRERVLSTNEGRYLRFARLVDEEYQKVMASSSPAAEPVLVTSRPVGLSDRRASRSRGFMLLAAALIGGALAGRQIVRRSSLMQ